MRIKMKVLGSGPDGMLNVGEEYDIDDSMGQELVDGGYAELISDPPAAKEAKSEAADANSEPPAGEDPPKAEPAAEEKPKRTSSTRKAAAKETKE